MGEKNAGEGYEQPQQRSRILEENRVSRRIFAGVDRLPDALVSFLHLKRLKGNN